MLALTRINRSGVARRTPHAASRARCRLLSPRERDVAMVFQNYALYPNLTVRQNIGFSLANRKIPKAERDAKVREAAAVLGLADMLDRKPRQLSGGQRQRAAMGRAIVREPAAPG